MDIHVLLSIYKVKEGEDTVAAIANIDLDQAHFVFGIGKETRTLP
jgi:hypothetical protein